MVTTMKKIKRTIILVVIIQILAVAFIVGNSTVKSVTLATENVYDYNRAWSIEYEDGRKDYIESIPYYGNSKSGETVIARNVIWPEMCGKTICFLSADRSVQISVDDKLIYEFGVDDEHKIGRTPGSVMVFANLPDDCAGKIIEVRMKSPYDNFASYMTDVIIANRDVAILHFIREKLIDLFFCLGVFLCGVIILIFAMVQRNTQNSAKLMSIGLYLLVLFLYHIIETKVPMIFYGNQFLYSNLVFISLMTAPLFSEMYLYFASPSYQKGMRVLMVITLVNIITQLGLQLFNIVDFMDMSLVSHGLLAIVIVFVLSMEFRNVLSKRRIDYAFVGILAMSVCGAIDLVRCYIVKIGDLAKYSRIGVFIFGICVIITCMKEVIQKQVQSTEKEKNELFSSEIIQTLVTAIDAKDIYTKGHSTRVADYSVILAEELGWDEERIKSVRYKALLHDVGKIGIPDRVLNKADRLTNEEFAIIKSHTTIGSDILNSVSSLSDMHLVARHHHERYDGKGYPDSKHGEDIPEEARLVGIVDAYDAMSSDRAYRKALPDDVIRNELVKGKGTQFDPDMVEVFIRLFDEGKLKAVHDENENEQRMKDVSSMISDMIAGSVSTGAIKMDVDDIGKVYQYIGGIHSRYGIDYNTILISLTWEEGVTMEEVASAMTAMEYSIRQSLRKVDIMTRVSESQFLIVLTEAHEQNLQMIVDRIFTSFYSNSQNAKIKPGYEIK